MISISECFNLVGQNGCVDVASSLAGQGCDPEISIPIYEVFYLKLCAGEKTGFIAGSIPEYNALRKTAINAGAVAATINLLDLDILTLLAIVMVYTPNTGMNLFFKWGEILTGELTEEVISAVAALAGIPPELADGLSSSQELLGEALTLLTDKLTEAINALTSDGINVMAFEEFPQYYNMLCESGEMLEMRNLRNQLGAMIM